MTTPVKRADFQTLRRNALRVINAPLRYDNNAMTISMDLPGFSYSNFNRVGYINFWSLMKSMEALNRISFKINLKIFSWNPNIIHVVAAQVIDVHPKLYEDASIATPFVVTMRPAHVGYKSFSNYIELTGKESSFIYLQCQRSVGFLDNNTKKGVPIPDDIRKIHGKVKDPLAKPVYVDQPKAPDSALKYHLRIEHSDTDQLYHSNQSSYIRYCLDAAANACNHDKLSNFHGDFFCYRISRAEILYKRESLPGDDLEITFWEDKDSPNTLHFIVSVTDELSAVVNFSFFPENFSKL